MVSTTVYTSLVNSDTDLLRTCFTLSSTLSTCLDSLSTFAKQPSRSSRDGAEYEWRLIGVQVSTFNSSCLAASVADLSGYISDISDERNKNLVLTDTAVVRPFRGRFRGRFHGRFQAVWRVSQGCLLAVFWPSCGRSRGRSRGRFRGRFVAVTML